MAEKGNFPVPAKACRPWQQFSLLQPVQPTLHVMPQPGQPPTEAQGSPFQQPQPPPCQAEAADDPSGMLPTGHTTAAVQSWHSLEASMLSSQPNPPEPC